MYLHYISAYGYFCYFFFKMPSHLIPLHRRKIVATSCIYFCSLLLLFSSKYSITTTSNKSSGAEEKVSEPCIFSHLFLLLFSDKTITYPCLLNRIIFLLHLFNLKNLPALSFRWIITGDSTTPHPPCIEKHRKHCNICWVLFVFIKCMFDIYIYIILTNFLSYFILFCIFF